MPSPLPPPPEFQKLRGAIDKLREVADLLGDQEAVDRFHVDIDSRRWTLKVILGHADDALAEVEKLSADTEQSPSLPEQSPSRPEQSPSLTELRRIVAECGKRYDALEKDWSSSTTPPTAEFKVALESLLSAIKAMQRQSQ